MVDPAEDPRDAAIEQLESFGLSTYAARTFVALAVLGTGTAKDVSQVSDVPRTRVYDAVNELQDEGLVDIQQTSPKEFWAVSAETTGRKFEQELERRLSTLTTALNELEPAERQEEQRGVWTVDGDGAVTDRVLDFVAEAEEEIVYMTVSDLLTEEIVEALRAAAARGVSIRLAGLSPAVEERIQEQVPEAELFESLWVWSETTAGRLLMVDRDRTLVSVLVDDGTATEKPTETAIWGSGESNALVAVLKAIFTWHLEAAD